MTQATTDQRILPTTGALGPVVAEAQALFDALFSSNFGTTAPPTVVKGMFWVDTTATPHSLKIYDGSSWVLLGKLDAGLGLFDRFLRYDVDQVLDAAAKARANKSLGNWREVARSTLSGASVFFDLSTDARRFLVEIDDLKTSSGDGSLYVRCANVGGAADQGASDYYGQSEGRAGGSDISGDATSNLCALGGFGVTASGRMTMEGSVGTATGQWAMHFEGRMSNSTVSTMAVREFIRTASGRKPRLYLFTNAVFGGGTIVVSERV